MNNKTGIDIYSLAYDLIANTSQSVYITGKAGSGKTTFLKRLAENVDKKKAIAAPTGIAAINAGGVTLHSLLQLPFDIFTPDFEGKRKLDFQLNLRKSKIELLEKLELLIIDEVSMVRADLLDAVDYTLKRYRNNNKPFGGIQMIFIGDLFQLPPVVASHEWEILKNFYDSPLFLDAHALKNNIPVCIELNKIYRQQDEEFVKLLNHVRNNTIDNADLAKINSRFVHDCSQTNNAITLTTHNSQANKINEKEISKLQTESKIYDAYVKGDFFENSYPTEYSLHLKEGARVMFVKNDSGEFRKYYNGKLGKVVEMTEDIVVVSCDDGDLIEVERSNWKNIRYKINKETNEIKEENIGEFSQFPLRLAWAITIHKSQGLTFDNIIIDAERAFAEGQVYVALSRCRSLSGIILKSKIPSHALKTHPAAILSQSLLQKEDFIIKLLEKEKTKFLITQLQNRFDILPLINILDNCMDMVYTKKIPKKDETLELIKTMIAKTKELCDTSIKFQSQISLIAESNNLDFLKDRVQKAISYFQPIILNDIYIPLRNHIRSVSNVSKIKKYRETVTEHLLSLENIIKKIEHIKYGEIDLTDNLELDNSIGDIIAEKELIDNKKRNTNEKSQNISLRLFREGKSLEEIAQERGLTISTILNHLAQFIPTNEVKAEDLLDSDTYKTLFSVLSKIDKTQPLKILKESLSDKYTYNEIKIVLASMPNPEE